MKKYKFNIEKYNFRKIIEDYFSTCDLENINDLEINIEKGEDCLTTKYHQIYLYWFNNDDRFKILYDDFIHEYVSKLFNEKILYENYYTPSS